MKQPEKANKKPLYWEPNPDIGYHVTRRDDGAMYITFTAEDRETLMHWRDFAMHHLIYSDEPNRNLYDLRKLEDISEETLRFAIEVNSDPSTRNLRVAVVVANQDVADAIIRISKETVFPGGTEMGLFLSLGEAEAWLDAPFTDEEELL